MASFITLVINRYQAEYSSVNFIDPNDPTVYTNTIEGVWGNCKTKFYNMHSTLNIYFEAYLQDYLFYCLFHNNIFGNLAIRYITTIQCSVCYTPVNAKTALFRATI